jgi:uncharacterized membrane protein YeaQ/YmgE (transglycosylase-associated protein family)
MDLQNLVVSLLIGAVAGWLAGLIMKGHGLGLVGNILVGIIGGVIGNVLLGKLDISTGSGIAGAIGTALIGSVVLLFVVSLIKKA